MKFKDDEGSQGERKILRRIFTAVNNGDNWRVRNDQRLDKLINSEDFVRFMS